MVMSSYCFSKIHRVTKKSSQSLSEVLETVGLNCRLSQFCVPCCVVSDGSPPFLLKLHRRR